MVVPNPDVPAQEPDGDGELVVATPQPSQPRPEGNNVVVIPQTAGSAGVALPEEP